MKLLAGFLVFLVNICIISPEYLPIPPGVGKRYILETSKKPFRASRSPSLTSNSAHEVSPENRVFGGKEASDGQFPYVAYKHTEDNDYFRGCTAGIISPNWVVTAAHCLEVASNPNQHLIAAGKADLNLWIKARESNFMHPVEITDLGLQERRVEAVFYHPEFNSSIKSNDIGLMKLKRSFDFDNRVSAMPLSRTVFEGSTDCVITGYGSNENNDSYILRYVSGVSVLPSKHCKYEKFDGLCMGRENYGLCKGDSGGPLVCGNSVTGVASFVRRKVITIETLSAIRGTESTTANCWPSGSYVYKTYFTDVQKHLSWIDKILAEN